MKKPLKVAILSAFLLLLGVQGAIGGGSPASILIQFPNETVNQGDKVIMMITVSNVSTRPLVLEDYGLVFHGEQLFKVGMVGPDDRPVPLTKWGLFVYSPGYHGQAGTNSTPYRYILEPQDEMRYTADLTEIYDMNKIGRYVVVASRNIILDGSQPIRITSNSATITVIQ